jgi:hypothetical protein
MLYGECLSGALYWNDFENLAKKVGFTEPRLVSSRAITIDNDELAKRLGGVKFTSVTYRLFKAKELETDAQDYGQSVTYLGSIQEHELHWQFDTDTRFMSQECTKISGNTWHTLKQSRFAAHFEFHGNFDKHQGLFATGNRAFDFIAQSSNDKTASADGCVPTLKPKSSCC